MPYNITKNRTILLVLGDIVIASLSLAIAIEVRFPQQSIPLSAYSLSFFIMVPLYPIVFYISDGYNIEQNFRTSYYAARHLVSVSIATLIIAIGHYLIPEWKFGRGLYFLNYLFVLIISYLWRIYYQSSIARIMAKRIVIVGAGGAGMLIAGVLRKIQHFDVVGFIDDDSAKWNTISNGYVVFGGTDSLSEIVKVHNVDTFVVAIHQNKNDKLLSSLLKMKLDGVDIYDMPTLCEDLTGKLPINYLSYDWLLSVPFAGLRRSVYRIKVKRFIDTFLALLGLLLTAPLLIVIAILIKLDSPGPVFFWQKRTGLNGKIFLLLKLRSMCSDAEQDGAVWAMQNDSRITRIGKFIRYFRIDEIPQMLNVLMGEMSFIGPRPERPEFEEYLEQEIPLYTLRHSVLPGISGWAQINYRYGASKEDAFEKLQYDLYYIKRMSFLLDMQILLKTIRVIMMGSGAR